MKRCTLPLLGTIVTLTIIATIAIWTPATITTNTAALNTDNTLTNPAVENIAETTTNNATTFANAIAFHVEYTNMPTASAATDMQQQITPSTSQETVAYAAPEYVIIGNDDATPTLANDLTYVNNVMTSAMLTDFKNCVTNDVMSAQTLATKRMNSEVTGIAGHIRPQMQNLNNNFAKLATPVLMLV